MRRTKWNGRGIHGIRSAAKESNKSNRFIRRTVRSRECMFRPGGRLSGGTGIAAVDLKLNQNTGSGPYFFFRFDFLIN